MTNTSEQMLIIQDEHGACYGIPQAALASFRLSDEEFAGLETQLSEVSGYQAGIGLLNHLTPLTSLLNTSRFQAVVAPVRAIGRGAGSGH